MTRREIERTKGRMEAGVAKGHDAREIVQYIDQLEDMLDEADEQDTFGTEGWRHRLGVE